MLCIEQRKLQCVDHTADGVDHATSHQPYKSGGGKGLYQWNHSKHTQPAHGNVDGGREPFWTGDPECLDQHACNGNSPHKDQKRDSYGVSQRNHTNRGVASSDQNKDHHMIDLT